MPLRLPGGTAGRWKSPAPLMLSVKQQNGTVLGAVSRHTVKACSRPLLRREMGGCHSQSNLS